MRAFRSHIFIVIFVISVFQSWRFEEMLRLGRSQIYFFPNQTVQINWKGIAGKSLTVAFKSTGFDQNSGIGWDGISNQVQLLNLQSETITVQHDFSPFLHEELMPSATNRPGLFYFFPDYPAWIIQPDPIYLFYAFCMGNYVIGLLARDNRGCQYCCS